jgi:SAM-dependent methyltransferase
VIERIARHYEGRWRRGYVRGKLRSDPAYAAAFDLLRDSPLPVLDLGCGIGLLEFYLRERGFAPPLAGIDFDGEKIAQAQRIAAARYREVSFAVRDLAREGEAPVEPALLEAGQRAGHVVIFDLLHYLPASAQHALLERVAAHVAPGGVCLIRATPRDTSWRFQVTQLEEFWLRASLWMKSGARHYATASEILTPFRARDFTCEVRPLWGRTPFNSHLFVLRAPAHPTSL